MEGKKIEEEIRQIKSLLKRNLEYSRQAIEIAERNKRYILWIKIINLLKLIVILIPIILALIYLPPVVKEFVGKYKDLFGPGGFFIEYFSK